MTIHKFDFEVYIPLFYFNTAKKNKKKIKNRQLRNLIPLSG